MTDRYELLHHTKWIAAGGSPHASRSTVYGWSHALALAAELDRRGIIGADFRDTETSRKVRTIVGELSRLASADPDQSELDALVDTYLRVRDLPLAVLIENVRIAADAPDRHL